MTIARVLAVAAAFASVVLGFASPARADQLMQGIYTYTQGDVGGGVDHLPDLRPDRR